MKIMNLDEYDPVSCLRLATAALYLFPRFGRLDELEIRNHVHISFGSDHLQHLNTTDLGSRYFLENFHSGESTLDITSLDAVRPLVMWEPEPDLLERAIYATAKNLDTIVGMRREVLIDLFSLQGGGHKTIDQIGEKLDRTNLRVHQAYTMGLTTFAHLSRCINYFSLSKFLIILENYRPLVEESSKARIREIEGPSEESRK